jgi:hypothetical protein
VLAASAVLGLTSCDGEADHYYVFFGKQLADPGPSCATWCVKTQAFNADGSFDVHIGHKVRFVNFASGPVKVELLFAHIGGTGTSKIFTLAEGGSKKIKIGQNLVPDETTIEVVYSVGNQPPQGGPDMIVRP